MNITTDNNIVSPSSLRWLGPWTLYKREVWRFMKVWNQTLLAPMVSTLVFLAILTLALGGMRREVSGIPFELFVTPGLIMMAVIQNAFANPSSSLILSKIQGVIIDVLMPPLTAADITIAYILGGITRGFLVGISVMTALYVFVPYSIENPGLAFIYLLLSSMTMALLGLICGLYAQSFDQMSAFTNYIITPLSFLSGTFYSIHALPPFWQQVSSYNPFFYMIDGLRHAFTGYSETGALTGIAVLGCLNILLCALSYWLIHTGWRLKS